MENGVEQSMEGNENELKMEKSGIKIKIRN